MWEALRQLRYCSMACGVSNIAVTIPQASLLLTEAASKFEKPWDALRTYKSHLGKSSVRQAWVSHTRWATHGAVTNENAHPHFDQSGSGAGSQRRHRELSLAARRSSKRKAILSDRRQTPKCSLI